LSGHCKDGGRTLQQDYSNSNAVGTAPLRRPFFPPRVYMTSSVPWITLAVMVEAGVPSAETSKRRADTIFWVVPTILARKERLMETDLPDDTGSLQDRFVREFLPWLKRRVYYLRRAQYRPDQIEELLAEASAMAWSAYLRCPKSREWPGKLARFSVLQSLGGRRLCQAKKTSLESGHRGNPC
jgi:hypothetical protein